MPTIYFDTETDSLQPTKMHCISVSVDGGEPKLYLPDNFPEAKNIIDSASILISHNLFGFDLDVIKKFLEYKKPDKTNFRDTLLLSQLIFPDIFEKSQMLELKIRGSHSLKAWGQRLKFPKDSYEGDWKEYTDEMGKYCLQDTRVLVKVYERLQKENYSEQAIELEHQLAPILTECTKTGFAFDITKANELYSELIQKRFEIQDKLTGIFPPIYLNRGIKTPTKTIKYKDPLRANRTEGGSYTQIELQEFNSFSRPQIAERFKRKYDWEPAPDELTPTGRAEINEAVLTALPFPEAAVLAENLMVQKLIGSLAEGKQNWMAHASVDSRIHTSYRQVATATRRSSHQSPNISQVPSCRTELGAKARSLFIAPTGKVLVDVDQDAVELRCLSHYLTPWDKGSLAFTVDKGSKEDKTDIHTLNSEAIGCSRDSAKTCLYACLYGAGLVKLGNTLEPTFSEQKARNLGKHIRSALMQVLEGYEELNTAVQDKYKERGYILSLDKGKVVPRSEHSALNFLLQSAGAILSKQWILYAVKDVQDKFTKDQSKLICWTHDAITWESNPDISEDVLAIVSAASVKAGEHFNFKCPIKATGTIGSNWAIH